LLKSVSVPRVLFYLVYFRGHMRFITRHGIAARYDSVIGRNALVCCKWFDWSLTDFIHGTLLLSNTYFRQHFLNNITDAQRQFELFVRELLDLREHSSILTNGMTAEIRDWQFNCIILFAAPNCAGRAFCTLHVVCAVRCLCMFLYFVYETL